jgi:hypothetical protein
MLEELDMDLTAVGRRLLRQTSSEMNLRTS